MVAAQEAVVNFEAELQEGLQRLEEFKTNLSMWSPIRSARGSHGIVKMFTSQMGQEDPSGSVESNTRIRA